MSEFTEELKSDFPDFPVQDEPSTATPTSVESVLEQGKSYVTANPMPIIAGALALGFVLGMLVPKEKEPEPKALLDGRLDELKDLLSSFKSKVGSRAESKYDDVSSIVGDVITKAKKRFSL